MQQYYFYPVKFRWNFLKIIKIFKVRVVFSLQEEYLEVNMRYWIDYFQTFHNNVLCHPVSDLCLCVLINTHLGMCRCQFSSGQSCIIVMQHFSRNWPGVWDSPPVAHIYD